MKKSILFGLNLLFLCVISYGQNPSIPLTYITNQWIGTYGNIFSSSNIGIGMENPQYTLDILESGPTMPNSYKGIRIFDDQDINNYNFLKINKTNNQNWGFEIKNNGIYSHIRQYGSILNIASSTLYSSSPSLPIENGISIAENGWIGIGTANPGTKFQINHVQPLNPFNSFINGRARYFQLWVRKDGIGNNDPIYAPLPKFLGTSLVNQILSFSIVGDNDVKIFENGPTSGGYFNGSNNGLVATSLYSSNNPNKNCTGIYCFVEGNNPDIDLMNQGIGIKGNVINSIDAYGLDFRVEAKNNSIGGRFISHGHEESYGLLVNSAIDAFGGEPTQNSRSFGIYSNSNGGEKGSFGIFSTSDGSPEKNFGIYSKAGLAGLTQFTPTGTGIYSWGGYFAALGTNSTGESGGLFCETQSNSFNSFGIYAKAPNTSSTSGYAGYFDGDLFCTSPPWGPSDERLKENIIELENGLDIIESLNPKSFSYKKNLINEGYNLPIGNKFGLIAQEVESILPELTKKAIIYGKQDTFGVSIKKNMEILAVDYTSLIPILISAVKEQQNTIKNLTRKIELFEEKKISKNIFNDIQMKDKAELFQNNPNPFNESSTIKYRLSDNAKNASIIIFNMNGNTIKEIVLNSKIKDSELTILGNDLPSGMYIYSLIEDGKEIDTKRMILTK